MTAPDVASTPVEMSCPRVAVVDDHELLAHSAAYALRAHGIEAHVVEVTTLAAIEADLLRIHPQIVLLDLHLGTLGLSTPLISSMHAAGIDVVVMTGETDRAVWGACIEAGAAALVEKRLSFDELVERLRRIVAGDAAIAPFERLDLLKTLNERRRDEHARLEQFTRLTAREAEVLHGLVRGMSAEDIAAETYVSIATVRSHIRAILQKLGVNSQLAAVAVATKAGWRLHETQEPPFSQAGNA
jgi:two-component system, NarL family, nitrate/nitrite response regulator NarL